MATRKEKAEVDAMRDELIEMRKRLAELEKTDSKEARCSAGALKGHINRKQHKYGSRLYEIVMRDHKKQLKK